MVPLYQANFTVPFVSDCSGSLKLSHRSKKDGNCPKLASSACLQSTDVRLRRSPRIQLQ
jgi:hypothetical protein